MYIAQFPSWAQQFVTYMFLPIFRYAVVDDNKKDKLKMQCSQNGTVQSIHEMLKNI